MNEVSENMLVYWFRHNEVSSQERSLDSTYGDLKESSIGKLMLILKSRHV